MDEFLKATTTLNINLQPAQVDKFRKFAAELTSWNNRLNLTGITALDDIFRYHFLDSLTVVSALSTTQDNNKIIDVGSGGGFPGIPLAIACPHLNVNLLEATGKKTDFLNHIRDTLKLDNVSIVNERAETAAHNPDYRENFDIAIARAVADLAVLAELLLPFCKTGGRMIAMKKGVIKDEIKHAVSAIDLLGGSSPEIITVDNRLFPDNRYLVTVSKQGTTPAQYPRRPGIPAKRPLS